MKNIFCIFAFIGNLHLVDVMVIGQEAIWEFTHKLAIE